MANHPLRELLAEQWSKAEKRRETLIFTKLPRRLPV